MRRIRAIVSGRVQGVSYRASTAEKARQLGLVGWVRNLDDGRVEAVLQGTREQVESMIKWCYRGPSEAQVTDIAVTYEAAADEFQDFGIR